MTALLLSGGIGQATVLRVQTDGNDANDGSSWLLAKRSVGNALAIATAGDQVWVAAGTYFECVVVKEGVSLYGGFAGNESTLTQRNWMTNLSVLNGGGTNGPIVTVTNAGPATRVDGMVCAGGRASGGGGGVRVSGAAPVIANNYIRSCYAGGSGGGVLIAGSFSSSLHPVVTNNLIVNNWAAGDGGGIEITGSSPLIAWNQIFRNSASYDGGGIGCIGNSAPLIANNFIEANSAGRASQTLGKGGGVYAWAGNAYSICTPDIINNVIAANGAVLGGGINLVLCNGRAMVKNNTVVANSGAGIAWTETFPGVCPSVCNNLVAFNSIGLEKDPGVPFALTNNNVFGNTGLAVNSDYLRIPNATGQNGNISADPRLADHRFGNFHLQPDSPCRNAGMSDPLVLGWPDLDGQSRADGAVDIGADESVGTVWSAPVPVLHVSTNGNDGADGLTWATAKRTVRGALDTLLPAARLAAGTLPAAEVRVARGSYAGSISLPAFAYLYGGFAGTETNRADRALWDRNHETIFDGANITNVVACENGGYLVSRLDGFTVRNGMSDKGGGIRCQVSSPVIANNLICSNSANVGLTPFGGGAGIHFENSNPLITDNVIAHNVSTGRGGGLYGADSYPMIEQNTFSHNSAQNGTAIYIDRLSPRIAHNIISNNVSATSGNIMGGAVVLLACYYPVVEGNLIRDNVAQMPGASGAGLYFTISFSSLGGLVQNNLFVSNSAASYTGGGGYGGGLNCIVGTPSSPVFIVNNSFVGNRATGLFDYGGAIMYERVTLATNSNDLVIANNLIVSNSSGIYRQSGSATLRNNCLFGNTAYHYNGDDGIPPTAPTDLLLDPMFVNAGAGNYHLSASSPCIDAGTPTNAPSSDFDGVARALDGNNDGVAGFDIGAFEFIHASADTDRDGMSDQAEMTAGTTPTDAASVLKLRSRCLDGGAGVALAWDSVMGRTYSVQFRPGLSGGWQTLTNGIAGCGAMLEVRDCPLTVSNRFYRLQVDGNSD